MTIIGTPFTENATKVLLLGSGELGKEVAIEAKRLGCEVIALDRYENAPAMQVADRSHVVTMLDGDALEKIIIEEQPSYIVPEIEAIDTAKLITLEQRGFKVVPSAKAAHLTMNREGIRRLVSQELSISCSSFRFAEEYSEFKDAVEEIGYPCVVKPIMSSSGKGQSTIKSKEELKTAWQHAQKGGRAGAGRVIVESFIEFDYEITLLTVNHKDGLSFCEPIGHRQEDGDYRESWQPQKMSELALERAKGIANKVVSALGGYGIFGVELFVKGDEVYFSEVSPRPHDTGMVTLISQDLSEFALHVRAFLEFAIPTIDFKGPSASVALLAEGESSKIGYCGVDEALSAEHSDFRLFGKPEVNGRRRMGVCLARAEDTDSAVEKALTMADKISYALE